MNSKPTKLDRQLKPRSGVMDRRTRTPTEPSPHSVEKLLHELRVHQIELEMQNEELQHARVSLEASHNRYLNLYEFAPVGYLTLTPEGKIIEINLTAAALLGVERNNLVNRHFAGLVVPKDSDRWHRLLKNILEHEGEQKNFELMLKRDDSYIHARLDCLPVITDDQTPVLRITLTDISESKRAEEELRIAAVAFEAQEGIMITNADKVMLRVNRAFTDITGYSAEELVGQMPHMFKSGRHSETFYAEMWECINRTGSWQGEIWDRRKSGDIYPKWVTITAVKDSDGTVTHYVGLHTDISTRKASEEVIKQLAYYDPLTALPNRRLLMDRLQQALAASARSKKYGALLFIDLDNFKSLNDHLGHDMGDVLLQQVAQRLIDCVREGDTVSRQGGDEFIVMLEDLSGSTEEAAAKAKTIGEKIITSLNQAYQLTSHEYRNTPSIGITLFINHQHEINMLLKRADIAMYGAKAAGRNTLRFFDQNMQEAVTARAALEADLRFALTKNQFRLYFQRQARHDGQTIGAEALLRWKHPKRGFVSPLEFIPLAEEIGLIIPIGQWVLETACAQLKRWESHPQTCNLQLAVNVSAHQFHQPDFTEHVFAILNKTAIKAHRLKLEFTESLVFDDIDDTIAKMQVLKKIGVSFSIDDFGTGYSSLTYLTQLPFDQLKIDQSFVRNIGVKSTDTVIVQTIIGMATNLGMDIIAEGVETEEQLAFLELHGCHIYQGNLIGKTMPQEEFERSLGI
ncbi:putative bifunctional diguanylate cyclase/phosphodiesterase [Methylobacter tundripaludum]|uniref:cyclic-guanylate-specific phosphodiesterase n=1 Tax=Methylobacter tundripaludum (strain ATCC BAA-1195 / DSM 17260 / SV96) TaxID=697282 RepID=G3J1J8_METTV|nr:EAL domain-containing protein [Methylobacter tundripaludum]EGW21070.1 diguanylate cyclase/phosphodiesterase with PAS/PAC sensor(s) [Methylobacter tundripaludum SV96]